MNVRAVGSAATFAALAWACSTPQTQAESREALGLSQPREVVEQSAPRESPELGVESADGWREAESAAGTWRVRWRCEPDPPTFGETGRILIEAAREDGLPPEELRADAGMPEHGHGLLRVPRVEALGHGRFAVENVYLHMPGTWRVYLDLGREGIFERFEFELEVD